MEQPAIHYMNTLAVGYPINANDLGLVEQFLKASPADQTFLLDTFKILGSGFGMAGCMEAKHSFKVLRHGLKTCINIKVGVSQHVDKLVESEISPEETTKCLSKLVGFIVEPLCFLKSAVYLTHQSSSQLRDLVNNLDATFDAVCALKKPLSINVNYVEISRLMGAASQNKLSIAKHSTALLGIAFNMANYPCTSLALDIASYACSIAQFISEKRKA